MEIKSFITDPTMLVNTFIALCNDTRKGVLIDPGKDCFEAFAYIEQHRIVIEYIVNTHTHPDHCAGNAEAHQRYRVPVLLHEKENKRLQSMARAKFIPAGDYPCRFISHEDILIFGKAELKIIETPGHTDGSISLLNGNALFTGDLLSIGDRTGKAVRLNFENDQTQNCYQQNLLPLIQTSKDIVIYPGHGPAFKHADCMQRGEL